MNDEFDSPRNAGEFVRGNEKLWKELLRKQIPRLYRMFMQHWPNHSLAEELVQKTIFDAVRGRGSYDVSKGCFEKWICGIARNNIRLEIRKRASRPSIDGDISKYIETIDKAPLPEEIIERKEMIEIVRSALDSLKDKEKNVLKAKYIENLRASEIALRMDVPEKSVHNLLYSARISLRNKLKSISTLK